MAYKLYFCFQNNKARHTITYHDAVRKEAAIKRQLRKHWGRMNYAGIVSEENYDRSKYLN